jgi:tRNA nucleotidyltransferase (CCA-adding enzyme)
MMSRGIQVISTHINADFDGLASMLAAKKLYPEARLVFPGAQERSLREFFVQSTFYLFEVDRMRDMDLDQITTLILVDTRQRSRIGKLAEILDRPGLRVVIYDHHPPSDDDIAGDLEVIREVGATATIMVEELRRCGVKLTADEATVLALGIYEDTGSLTFSSTKEEDFLAMAYLRSEGARLSMIPDLITRELTADQVFLLNDLIRSARKVRVRGVEVVIASASSDHYVGDFAVLVHKLRDMENIDVLFALARMEERIYLVARSRVDSVNVGRIALEFGGGGHATAASATIRELGLVQVEERLLSLLQEHVRPLRTAREIMSFPVKTIDAQRSIKDAAEVLSRFNINVLPVTEQGNLVGLISRVVVQRATFHGLEELPVKEYMTSDFETAGPDTPLEEIRRIIVDDAQRFVPIMEGGGLVGCITRTDVLRDLGSQGPEYDGYAFDRVQRDEMVRRKKIHQMMHERLPVPVLKLLVELGRVADELHMNAFVVGGFVRDLLLRQENLDLDVVVEGDAVAFARGYVERHGGRFRTHQKFQTAMLIFPDGFKVDVATARTEYYEHPAALPRVELSSIKLDLYRRDFTINTLAIRLNTPFFGELLDFFGGQRDIKERIVRVLHNLSFVEDPTRVLRAVRFEKRFGFRIGKHTLNLIQNALRLGILEKVEGRRLWHELQTILQEKRPLPAVERLEELRVLGAIHPKLVFPEAKRVLFQEVEGALAWYDLLDLEEPVQGWRVYLLALLDQLTDTEVKEVMERLGFSPREADGVATEKRAGDRALSRIHSSSRLSPSQVYELLKPFSVEVLLYLVAKGRDKQAKRRISRFISRDRSVRPALKGEDLKAMGLQPGPVFRQALDALREARLDGRVHTRQEEEALVRERFLDSRALAR